MRNLPNTKKLPRIKPKKAPSTMNFVEFLLLTVLTSSRTLNARTLFPEAGGGKLSAMASLLAVSSADFSCALADSSVVAVVDATYRNDSFLPVLGGASFSVMV